MPKQVFKQALKKALKISTEVSAQAGTEKSTPTTDELKTADEKSLPVNDIGPNPYLENRKPIPAKAEKRFAAALAAMDAGQWQQAESPLLQLTIDYPDFSGAHLNLAICYRHLGKSKQAEDYFLQSISANGNNLNAYNWLALIKREQGDFQEADKLYQQALGIWPDHADSHYNLAILCELYLGDLQRARQHFMAYQKLQPQEDKQVAGWIKDLQRRINALAKNGGEQ